MYFAGNLYVDKLDMNSRRKTALKVCSAVVLILVCVTWLRTGENSDFTEEILNSGVGSMEDSAKRQESYGANMSNMLVLGLGLDRCANYKLHSYLNQHDLISVTFEELGCNSWDLDNMSKKYIDTFVQSRKSKSKKVHGDISLWNVKYTQYILEKYPNSKAIIMDSSKENELRQVKRWIFSLNKLPWLTADNNVSKNFQGCFPEITVKRDKTTVNDIVDTYINKYHEELKLLKEKYKERIVSISDQFDKYQIDMLKPFLQLDLNYSSNDQSVNNVAFCNVEDSVILHAPAGLGSKKSYLKKIGTHLKLPKMTCPENLLFLMVDNKVKNPLMQQSVDHHGCKNKILGDDIVNWNWFGKIDPILRFLVGNNFTSETYIISTDARDCVIGGNPQNIITKFLSYKTDMLFMNTAANWPASKTDNDFEMKVYGNTSRCHAHLSAGAWMGTATSVIPYLLEMKKSFESTKGHWDDQLTWRKLHRKYYPKIQVDVNAQIFTRVDQYLSDCLM